MTIFVLHLCSYRLLIKWLSWKHNGIFLKYISNKKKFSPSHDYSSMVHFVCCDILFYDHFHDFFLILSQFLHLYILTWRTSVQQIIIKLNCKEPVLLFYTLGYSRVFFVATFYISWYFWNYFCFMLVFKKYFSYFLDIFGVLLYPFGYYKLVIKCYYKFTGFYKFL